jgi:heme exporter protein A
LNASLARIEVKDLACVRGGRLIFRELSFALAAGEALSLEGANGAGKTSALRVLAGLLSSAAGSVEFHTSSGAVAEAEERGRLVGWLGHQDGIKNQLSVSENAEFFSTLYGADVDLRETLERVGLTRTANLPAQYLSAGQRRRLALTRLIFAGRPLWLLDEPLSALDSSGKSLIAELMREHCNAGGIVIAATHDPLGLDARQLRMDAS